MVDSFLYSGFKNHAYLNGESFRFILSVVKYNNNPEQHIYQVGSQSKQIMDMEEFIQEQGKLIEPLKN